MSENQNRSNNKRIAKNTLFLYFRMMLTMGVSLYTSRVVLATLGVEDFGIYGVVGGVVAMFGFLNSSMAGATSRFLTFEIGRKDYEKLKKTFSAALTVHIIVAIIILILGETIGLWWLENKLVIAPERMNAARWVFHLSVLASTISITQVPFNATIIAHERMNVYAYVEILNSVLRLVIVYLLVIGNFDKLILYAVLTLCVTVIITTIYKIYCARNFPESHYKFHWDKETIKPMISFSGWVLFGNIASIAKGQGNNMLLNLFFGVALNATYGITKQVEGAVNNLAINFLSALRPQIVKNYAIGNKERFHNLIITSSRLSFLLLSVMVIPVLYNVDYILKIWLKNPPAYSNIFIVLCLSNLLIDSLSNTLKTGADATGKIRMYQLVVGTLMFLNLPVSYFILLLYPVPMVMFWVSITISCIAFGVRLKFLERMSDLSVNGFIVKVIFKISIISVIMFIVYIIFNNIFGKADNLLQLLTQSILLILVFSFFSFSIGLEKKEQKLISNFIQNKLRNCF